MGRSRPPSDRRHFHHDLESPRLAAIPESLRSVAPPPLRPIADSLARQPGWAGAAWISAPNMG